MRNENCNEEEQTVTPRGLEVGETYKLWNAETEEELEFKSGSGEELTFKQDKRSAAIWFYEKK